MNKDTCQRYLEDPEAHASHLDECARCRELFSNLEQSVANKPVRVDTLPLAPWEGASHRSWSLVIGSSVATALIAFALFAAAGGSPLVIVGKAVEGGLPSADVFVSMFRLLSGAVQNAPRTWQIAIAIGFVAVNALFVVLLRKAPKGIDA
jgi:hypothetical protein